MIKLIVSDIDGCLNSGIGTTYNLEKLKRIQKLNALSKTEAEIPALTLCSGRQQPYMEAMLQVVGGYYPAIFENGGGIFDMKNLKIFWNPNFDDEKAQQLEIIKNIISENFIGKYNLYLEVGKKTAVGVLGYDQNILKKVYGEITEIVQEKGYNLSVVFCPLCH